jgi:hypothetical protein
MARVLFLILPPHEPEGPDIASLNNEAFSPSLGQSPQSCQGNTIRLAFLPNLCNELQTDMQYGTHNPEIELLA